MSTDLAARIDRLESIEAIKKLKHLYMHYCDLGYSPAKLGPLFTEDAIWTSKDFGHHAGRAAIEAFFGGVSAQIVFAAHLAMNFIIDVEATKPPDNGASSCPAPSWTGTGRSAGGCSVTMRKSMFGATARGCSARSTIS